MAVSTPATFAHLLEQAVHEPGVISAAYSQFHQFSVGNMLLAMAQCLARGIQPGPMATFPRWKELGRYVRKGEKAITLCQPVTFKRAADDETGDPEMVTRFTYRAGWFVLAMTDGKALPPCPTPTWDRSRALRTLDVAETPFDLTDGNCQGFARGRTIAISPIAALPWKTTFHELAHVALHTGQDAHLDDERTPVSLREVEAESVALLCCAALELPGVEFARGYIQHWWGASDPIPERSAQRILKAADQILKAGASAQVTA